jgi:hypothetical protein
MGQHFKIDEAERSPTLHIGDITLPGLAKTMAQREAKLQKEIEQGLIAQRQTFYDCLVEGAYHVFALQKAVEQAQRTAAAPESTQNLLRSTEIVKNRLVRWLKENGVEIENPTGQILDENLLPLVEVQDWDEPGDNRQDIVKETIKPIIKLRDGRIHQGQVIGLPATQLSATQPKGK